MDSKPIALDKANRDVSLFCLAKQISNDKKLTFSFISGNLYECSFIRSTYTRIKRSNFSSKYS